MRKEHIIAMALTGMWISAAEAKYEIVFGYINDIDDKNVSACAKFSQNDADFRRLSKLFKNVQLPDEDVPAATAPAPMTKREEPAKVAEAPAQPVFSPAPVPLARPTEDIPKAEPVAPAPVVAKADSARTFAELESKPHLIEHLKLITGGKKLERGKSYSWELAGKTLNVDDNCYSEPWNCGYKRATPFTLSIRNDGSLVTTMQDRDIRINEISSDGKTVIAKFTYFQKHCKWYGCADVGPFYLTTKISGAPGALKGEITMRANGWSEPIDVAGGRKSGRLGVGEMQEAGNVRRVAEN